MYDEMQNEIERLTAEYCGVRGVNHVLRVIRLVDEIARDQPYDHQVIRTAAYLHDWGAFPAWKQDGVDHAVRSTQVADELLDRLGCDPLFKQPVLECIATHHTAGPGRSFEATLFSDADILDLLGIVGLVREVGRNPGDFQAFIKRSRERLAKLPDQLLLERPVSMGKERAARLQAALDDFEAETFGLY